ncbi:MAG: GspE/PulE family protein [Candidatus Absconditabacteria bacterium]|nr:GspE/PulE family protein [Candidatus Absconditabacteria bacterium]MDD4714615.1 GspE/PulE family protein [Candidatus Absconditabacteria bacterium]
MTNPLINTILELNDVQALQVDFSQLQKIPKEHAEKIQTILYYKDSENFIYILTTNNHPEELQKIIKQLAEKGVKTKVFYTSVEGFLYALKRYDELEQIETKKQEEHTIQQQAEGKSAVKIIQQLYETRDSKDPGDFIMEMVRLSFQSGASDLHLQPEGEKIALRLRLDGILHDVISFEKQDFWKYLQKLKFISGAKMNIDYLPQDGRFGFEATNPNGERKKVDARVNFMPGMHMESTVIRFLDRAKGVSSFQEIGFSDRAYDILKRYIEKTTGIIIITGPTGSGKTTTLYSILHTLNTGDSKIITLEDPIEYEMPGIQQSQINYAKDYDYETGLKAVLRHDPDIILIGETRSTETAEIAINAALTGHLVFTTLHTNSAIASISRLNSMDVKPYLLAPALQLILGQRLVRKLCPHCVSKRKATYAEQVEIEKYIKTMQELDPNFKIEYDGTVPQANGCEQCNHTGYVGRVAILEILEITERLRQLIIDGANESEIFAKARANGFLSMQEDGILKVLQGKTTMEELHRVIA